MVGFTEHKNCIFHEFPFVLELLFILFTHKKLIDLHTSEGTFTFLLEKIVFKASTSPQLQKASNFILGVGGGGSRVFSQDSALQKYVICGNLDIYRRK